jgi:diguanylate cyclase (GGDEF)-like protein
MADGPAVGALLATFARPRPIDDELVELQVALALQATQALVRLRLQSRLEQQALHDPLTGLANRQLLHERLEQALSVTARTGSSLAVLFFDLDGFKQINDVEGHAAGDAVLVEVARRLTAAVRTGDVCARYGGDEFVVICEGASEEAAHAVAERVRSGMTRPYTAASSPVSASIGAVVLPGGSVATADALIERADAAMYSSKQGGRDRVTLVTI